ncbi:MULTISPECIES: iron uptake transporter permease EfeU [unclassified Streptomyces]|uniref:iron uptake transporter permease EfeU n=1 Tax=unclassified Streptomyces TaxID=2593676 RepID=UPI002E820BC8|nr:iron uptake transporter permease EfeU [Streptomyces sp. NBC_00589]WTI42898.1 FTR1 family protein [Streptomyces sp. NBC_00775]WUB32889.1 FTR1 family protein [Streptomyces sp. NBC_00589]
MWDDAFPSFLIGLREGLEAGLIVSVLVATLVRSGRRARLPHVWTGVAAAVGLSMSFGAILTFTSANLSGKAQEAFGGTLSLIAVVFVTAMVFWMRRSARTFSGEIKEKVTAALGMGAGVLVLTSFLAVGREGLETALFLWTTAQAAGSSSGPLTGAAAGLLIATALCWGLYRRVLHINLTRFFTFTGIVLIVIAAGVLGYGTRDLQESTLLPGGTAYAFDLSAHLDPSSWYVTVVQGTLNLTPQMTWLQISVYVAYLAVVMTLFVRGVRATAPAPAKPAAGAEAKPAPATAGSEPAAAKSESKASRRVPRWTIPVALLGVPALIAGVAIAVSDGKPASGTPVIEVAAADCGKGFTAPEPGRQTFQVRNSGSRTSEIYLIDPVSNAVYGEVEGIAPGTTRALIATVGTGSYAWRCVPSGGKAVTSAAVRVSSGGTTRAVLPVSEKDLAAPLAAYRKYVDQGLTGLLTRTRALQSDIDAKKLDKAREDWLPAHQQYASLGAAYGTFADFDAKINGRTAGLAGGVTDPAFTGFHRIEYGLWHGESAAALAPYAKRLTSDVAALRTDFPKQDFDPGDLPLRTHEILENTLHRELSGSADYGSGTELATTEANLDGTRELLGLLRPLIDKRDPGVTPAVDTWMKRTERLVLAQRGKDGTWTPLDKVPAADRQRLNGSLGRLLEELAPIPDLLEIRKAA